MPTAFLEGDDKHQFDRVVVKRNGWVVGIDGHGKGIVKHHYPPHRVRELEGDVKHERSGKQTQTTISKELQD